MHAIGEAVSRVGWRGAHRTSEVTAEIPLWAKRIAKMLVPKKNRLLVYKYLFNGEFCRDRCMCGCLRAPKQFAALLRPGALDTLCVPARLSLEEEPPGS